MYWCVSGCLLRKVTGPDSPTLPVKFIVHGFLQYKEVQWVRDMAAELRNVKSKHLAFMPCWPINLSKLIRLSVYLSLVTKV